MNSQANFQVEHLIVCYALLIMSDHTLCKKINNICSSGCKRWANPFDSQTYFEEIHNQNISRPCAPGSSFDQSACGCTQHVTDDTVIAQPTSKPSSRRNFDNHICWFWLQSCLLLITYIGLYFNNVSFQCPLMWYSIWKTKFTFFFSILKKVWLHLLVYCGTFWCYRIQCVNNSNVFTINKLHTGKYDFLRLFTGNLDKSKFNNSVANSRCIWGQ